MKNKKIFLISILILAITILTSFTPVLAVNENNTEESIPKVYSEAAILMDDNTGKILYDKDANVRKYPASTTKILTAILAIENCNLDDKVIVDYDSIMIVPSGYTVAALQVGEELTVKQLLQVLLIHSANDAANVLAKHVAGSIENFANMMNSKATEIGCKSSNFTNPSGKHDENHYSTAYDLALIMKYCMKNETFREIAASKSCIIPQTNKYSERIFTNTNELLVVDTREISSNYYYPYAIAGKTGYTSEAKNCLVSMAKKDDLTLICVVLGGVRTDEGLSARFTDTKELYEYGYNTYTIKKLREENAIAKQIEVNNATQDTKNLDLLISNDMYVLIKQKDINKEFEPEIILNENISAPINEGDILGKIKYNIEDIEYTSDLKASHLVKKNNFIFFIIQLILIGFIIYTVYNLYFNNKKPNHKKHKNLNNNYFFNKM